MAVHSVLLRRSLSRVLGTTTFSWHSPPSSSYKAVPGVECRGSSLSDRWGFWGASYLGLRRGFFVREKHGRQSSLNEDEIAERVRLAVRAAGSRKTGGGRPKVRRKRSVQWAPPAGTAGSEDLIESEVVLREDQALGQVVTSQANFMRVLVEKSEATAGDEAATAGGEKATVSGEIATAGQASAPAGSPRNGSELLCVVRALLKKIRKRVLVGDRVLVSAIDWVEGRGMIEEIVERKSQMEDPPIANVDHFLVLFALARPPLEPIQLSRFLVAAEHAGIPFTLALNKADLAPPGAAQAWKERLAGWGYNAHILSVEGGEGLEGVFRELSGKTTVVAGPSGAGKSSLINRLRKDSVRLAGAHADDDGVVSNVGGENRDGGDVRGVVTVAERGDGATVSKSAGASEGDGIDTAGESLAVSAVSAKSGLGRHTTRSIVLIRLPLGGLLADTPGFSLPALSKITEQELPVCFPEIRQRLAAAHAAGRHCAYKDCKHLAEPDCVVSGRRKRSDADGNGSVMVVEGPDGSLEEREVFEYQEGFAPWERYEEYKRLMAEVKEREDKERWAYGTKRESAVRVRKTDGATGKPKVEPRLAPQKHRRESRKLAKQGLETLLDEESEDEEESEGLVAGSDEGLEEGLEKDVKEETEAETGGLEPVSSAGENGGSIGRGGEAGNSRRVQTDGRGSGFPGESSSLYSEGEEPADLAEAGGTSGSRGTEPEAGIDAESGALVGAGESSESLGRLDEDDDGRSDEKEDEDFKDWLKTREFEYKWWEDKDAHLQGDSRLASVKSTRDVQRHWRLRKEKVLENRETVFGKKGPTPAGRE
ncbi:protein with ribosome small subunit-dependent GTPase domain [Klebsormidium nitens]|uniref:Protein with ribosome small subunit-dependent GTPase domain n=1 Tax=Klebsormidium nitens TaxID=105231 RepID=A0A1Y1HZH8_KLENI|nr:protein with ribosome small subunit-dependent GTPase domain [Klebsormidium nitens]|eukprot:GAQ82341.1 protein with ribosome small subunit-dependent GTPase domain [Klebsormidium nitens]